MARLGAAFADTGRRVIILSPAVSLRVACGSRLIYPPRLRRSGGVLVVFGRAVALPLLGALSSFVFFPVLLYRICARHQVEAVVIYNFSPLLLLVALITRCLLRIPLYHDVEDVSVPRFADWREDTEARPVQQLVFYFCMAGISRLSAGAILPTRRFSEFLPRPMPVEIVTGCMEVPPERGRRGDLHSKRKIHLLFAGKIEKEHGIALFIDALRILGRDGHLDEALQVDICGGGALSDWVRRQLRELPLAGVTFHGFVADEEYRRLLNQADICVALQRSQGRYSTFKTPSKVYEYLGNGKTVVATDVGDLAELPIEVIAICHRPAPADLAAVLAGYLQNRARVEAQGLAARRYASEHFATARVGSRLARFMNLTSPPGL